MPSSPPLLLLITVTAWTAMAMPKANLRRSEEERHSLAANGGLCYNTHECKEEGDSCRRTGKCRLDNAGYVCCCDFCSRRSINKSAHFCGDDGVTYTWCEYRREQCETNKAINILYKGQCNETCAKRRRDTLFRQATGMSHGYVPTCQKDNNNLYEITQCDQTDGLKCWCVLPDTNSNITEPRAVNQETDLNCEQEMRIAKLSCDPCKIIQEVLKAFPGAHDYDVYVAKKIDNTKLIARTHEPRSDVGIARKLFSNFDKSRDNFLEYRELIPFARWLLVSRDCVLDVLRICDDDEDNRINSTEWCTCLMNRYSIETALSHHM